MPVGRPKMFEFCAMPGCHKTHYAKGMCQAHYRRVHKPEIGHHTCFVSTCSAGQMDNETLCLAHVLERNYLSKGAPVEWLQP